MSERKSINEFVPGKVYQRGQILSWPLADKVAFVKDLKIDLVVNFWPKLDPDMSSLPCWYWYMPSKSEEMMGDAILSMANKVAIMLKNEQLSSVLILCEAGKTRSVFFASLVMHKYLALDGYSVLAKLSEIMPKHSMKPYMVEYLRTLK